MCHNKLFKEEHFIYVWSEYVNTSYLRNLLPHYVEGPEVDGVNKTLLFIYKYRVKSVVLVAAAMLPERKLSLNIYSQEKVRTFAAYAVIIRKCFGNRKVAL
jgi:hypothetical protein